MSGIPVVGYVSPAGAPIAAQRTCNHRLFDMRCSPTRDRSVGYVVPAVQRVAAP